MYSFNELFKASKQIIEGNKTEVAVLGNCSTQFLSKAVEGNCKLEGLNVEVFDADYNQIDIQLFDSNSDVYKANPDIIIVWMSTEKIYEEFLALSLEKRITFATDYVDKIKNYWKAIRNHSKAKIIQLNFSEIDDKTLGNYSVKVESTFSYQIRKLNYLLGEAMQNDYNVFPVDLLSIQIRIGTKKFFNPVLYYSSKMPIAIDALPFVSKEIVTTIKSLRGKIKKCLVMDLDNTIWGGVIGDDGLNNIEIGELGRGHVFSVFQQWIKQLKENGIILAVCSKNNESIAKEPFEKHPEMVLRLSDISLFVANWEDKASNIILIQKTLNIGMDSIVFIDDNQFERELVKHKIQGITVPDLPDDPAEYLRFLQEQNYFEVSSFVAQKADRTSLYQAEFERKKLELSFDSIEDYLKTLDMKCVVSRFEENNYSRIAQLSQRSNQFNLRTIRYTEEDIKRISLDDDYIGFTCELKDKYGNYGIVSVVVIKKEADGTGFVETWLMSCRALKRGLEEFTVNKMVFLCKQNDIKTLRAEYIPTEKNAMVKNIYCDFGFVVVNKNRYSLDVDEYVEKDNFIEEV